MRLLQLAVVIMGLLIVAGLAVIGGTLARRLGGTPTTSAPVVLDEPGGSTIVTASSGGDRLALQLRGGGPDRVVVVDMRSGTVVARVGLAR